MKKILSVLVVLLMIVVLGACSQESGQFNSARREENVEVSMSSPEISNNGYGEPEASEEKSDIEALDSEAQESGIEESENIGASEPEDENLKTEEENEESESIETGKTTDDSGNAVDAELKAVLDGYEAFMDDYIEFMQKYKNSDNIAGMLSDYAEIMKQYVNYMEAIEEYDPGEMSAADAAYYIEVTSRVSQKLLEVE